YQLDDYTRFVTMEEVLREYIKEVRVRKQADKFSLTVKDAIFNNFFEAQPLILYDGVPLVDADKLMSIDPLKVKEIQVMSRKYYIGSIGAFGIISCKTYEGDLSGLELDPNAIVINYDGLQRQREFYSPAYDTREMQQSRVPDYRNILYWNPEIKLDSEKKV